MPTEIIDSVSFKCVVAANVFYWLISTIVLYIDSLVAKNKSPWLKTYKIKPNHYISGKERRDLIILSAFNMLIVAPLISVPLFEILWDWIHGKFRLLEDDTWVWEIELLQKIPIQILVTEVGFYTIHIIMHSSPLLYKHIHKIHHRFQAPTAMACVYAHPMEFLLGNLLPIYMGPILTNAHPFTSYFWFVAAMVGTCKGHSGYKIFGHADYHEVHHYYYKYNYGGMYILDFLFGTMRL